MAIAKSAKKVGKRGSAGSPRSASKTSGQISKSQARQSTSMKEDGDYENANRGSSSLKSSTKTGQSMQTSPDKSTFQKSSGNKGASNISGQKSTGNQGNRNKESQSAGNTSTRSSNTNRNTGNQYDYGRQDENNRGNRYGGYSDDSMRNFREGSYEDDRSGNYRGGWNDERHRRGTSNSGRYDQADYNPRNQGRDEWNEGTRRMSNDENYRYRDQMSYQQGNQRDQSTRFRGDRDQQGNGGRRQYKQSRPSGEQEEGLRKLLLDQLKDMYWAEKALITKAIPKMINQASSHELIHALSTHLEETEGQVRKIEEIFRMLGKKAAGKKCEAMEGLMKEATEIMDELENGSLKDAGIICAAQKVEHYEIATYGCLKTYAEILDEMDIADLLEEILDEEKNADETLTQVAQSINWEAATENGEEEDSDDEKSGKRYGIKSNPKYSRGLS